MGWKPGNLLKKAFKGVRKVAKKIGKGIKKLGKKLLGAIGKIGPLGQLALMFIGIPPVISNFFGAIGGAITGALGTAGSAIGSFASSVAPNLTKAMGQAFSAIKTAGSGAYNTISQGISNGIDRVMNFTKGKGLTLSEGKTSIFTPKPEIDDLTKQITEATVDASVETGVPSAATTEERLKRSILEPDATKTTVDIDVPEKGFVESFKEKITDPKELAKRGGTAALDIIQQRATVAGMEDLPTQMHLDMTPFMMQPTEKRVLDATTWQGISNQYQQAGAFGGAASGDAATPYFAALGELDDNTFNSLVPTPTTPRPATPSFFN
jgi:hypothetical protein